MPVYPTPGKGTSTAGLNKDSGWGSRNAAGQVIDFQHAGDQGIDHNQGLWKSGLDTNFNARVTTRNVTPIAGTSATVIWTTLTAVPPGTVRRRVAGAASSAWTNPLTEAAGNKTAHSIVLTPLVVNTTYEYQITQPPLTAVGNPVEIIGTFRTPASLLLMEGESARGGQVVNGGLLSSGVDGGGSVATLPPVTPPLREPPGDGSATTVEGERERESASGLTISAYTVDTDPGEIIAFWRTSGYADGEMSLVNTVTNQTTTVTEPGNKRMNHEAVASDLEPNTVYLVRVTSTDAAGETATSDVQEVRTPA